MAQAGLLALTEDIYDAAAGGTPWARVGHGLATLLHARSASLMVGAAEGDGAELLCHPGIPDEAVAAYAGHYRVHDLWTRRAAAMLRAPGAAPRVLRSGQLVPDAEFLRSEFWNGFGRRYGLRYVVGTVVPLGSAGTLPIGLHRDARDAPFDEAEKRLLEAALPHLRRALQLRHRLAEAAPLPAEAIGPAALDGLSTAVVVVDAGLRVLLANAAAETLAAAGQGFRLLRPAGERAGRTQLTPCHRADAAALAALVGAAAQVGAPGGAARLRDADGSTVAAALVTPLPARLAENPLHVGGRVPGRALVLLRSLAAADPPRVALLRELFGLTAAEAEVARALAGGATKAAVAGARGLSETTVRTQVRAVLAKTGAANLRDLERMLAGLVGL